LILCVDSESNAWGDAKFRIPPLCYTYLTMHSRNTRKNELYAHSGNQLMADPTMTMDRHRWILQSAYALGFDREPEVTAFTRYWPYEITEDHKDTNRRGSSFKSLYQQRKDLDFNQSVEIAKSSDFILFSPADFRVLQLLEPLNKNWIYSKWNKTLPNVDYPSDHTLMACTFELAYPLKRPSVPTPVLQTPPASSMAAYSHHSTQSPSPHQRQTAMANMSAHAASNGGSISMSTLPTAQNRQYTPTPTHGHFNNQQQQQQHFTNNHF